MPRSGYRAMWIVAMFDLPTDTKRARQSYRAFRRVLLRDGFMMLQFSVYVRYCPSQENTTVHLKRIESNVPADGEVRIITLTDKQFERMHIFLGKRRVAPEASPAQLELF